MSIYEMTYQMTTQKQVRAAFWQGIAYDTGGSIQRKKVAGEYTCDTRCEFVEFVDMLQRDGVISEALAGRVTL